MSERKGVRFSIADRVAIAIVRAVAAGKVRASDAAIAQRLLIDAGVLVSTDEGLAALATREETDGFGSREPLTVREALSYCLERAAVVDLIGASVFVRVLTAEFGEIVTETPVPTGEAGRSLDAAQDAVVRGVRALWKRLRELQLERKSAGASS